MTAASETVERPTSRRRRIVAGTEIVVCDLTSAVLSCVPLVMLGMVVWQVKASVVGPPEVVLDSDERISQVLPISLALLACTLLPAVLGSLGLRRRAGWPAWLCTLVAAALALGPAVAGYLFPTTANHLFYVITNP